MAVKGALDNDGVLDRANAAIRSLSGFRRYIAKRVLDATDSDGDDSVVLREMTDLRDAVISAELRIAIMAEKYQIATDKFLDEFSSIN